MTRRTERLACIAARKEGTSPAESTILDGQCCICDHPKRVMVVEKEEKVQDDVGLAGLLLHQNEGSDC